MARIILAPLRFRLAPSLSSMSQHIPLAPSIALSNTTSLPWNVLSAQQREAWKVLGWNDSSWAGDGDAPKSDSALWGELSAGEQAAAKYGLGYSPESWDAELTGGDDAGEPEEGSRSNTGGALSSTYDRCSLAADVSPQKRSTGVVGSIFAAAKMGAKAVDFAIDARVNPLSAAQDLLGDVAVLEDTEALVYLDDSGSMSSLLGQYGSNLQSAKAAFEAVVPRLGSTPCRVVLFGSSKAELSSRTTRLDPSSIMGAWHATSGGTYMWKMIEDDITRRYRPGPGVLRVYVITDGYDVESPPPYDGPKGMDPLMKSLLGSGYNIQWSIVVVGMNANDKAARRYKDLCGATGGSFLALHGGKGPSAAPAGTRFLNEVAQAHSGDEAKARKVAAEKRKEYEREIQAGSAQSFNWYAALPPPEDDGKHRK